jgi:beta-galactosidase
MKNPMQLDRLLHGADYNPDQWMLDPEILNEDFDRMREAGLTTVTVGIFTWTLYELEEGRYTFEWMDRLLDRLAEEGMTAFLCTPSGSKPMWMSAEYPEIRRVNREGQRERSGHRHNHCPSSPFYRKKVAELNTRMASRYANHPAVKLWHISNELQGECFCNHCLDRFRTWLKERYETLENVTAAWWGRFWNHTFADWSQIDPRDTSIDGMQVDWMRFVNTLHVEFLQNEIAPLKQHSPNIPVTTNFMGFKKPLDYWRWAELLDVISNDSYPNYAGEEDMWRKAAGTALVHDLMRGMGKGRPWILMESSPSSVNWKPINKLKPTGVHPMECAQAVAHGADAVLYFQLRKGRGGSEKFHGAIVDHDSRNDTRVFKEVAKVGNWLKENAAVAGSQCPRAEVVLLHDWESQWALNASQGIRQPLTEQKDPRDAYHDLLNDHHRGWWQAGVATDVLWPDAKAFCGQLAGRRIVVASALYMLKPQVADVLLEFVRKGGRLILSHLSGVVDEHNRVLRGGLPGLGLHEAAGAKVEEIDALFEGEIRAVELCTDLKGSHHVTRAFGLLKLEGATPLAVLKEGHWQGQTVASRNSYGDGEVFVLAANFDDAFYRAFAAGLAGELDLTRPIPCDLPQGVHAAVREKAGEQHTFLINYSSEPKSVDLSGMQTSLETDSKGNVTLPPFGVTVLTKK